MRSGFLLAAWIWPILVWSQMGCREARHATGALLFSSERSLSRQLPALWTAGVLVALLTGSGAGIRLVLAGDWHSFAAWLAGALFIPSFALALGVWSGGTRAFEAIYTVWWYIGPAHQIPGLDFMGTTPASSTPGTYALAGAVLLALPTGAAARAWATPEARPECSASSGWQQRTAPLRAILIRFLGLSTRTLALSAEVQLDQSKKGRTYGFPRSRFCPQ